MGVADRRQQLVLGVGIEVDERHGCGVGWCHPTEQHVDQGGGVGARARQVVAPASTAVGQVDPAQEARDDLAQLLEHQLAVGAGLGERVGAQADQQRLERLPGAVHADVGERRRRQHAAGGIEGLGPRRLAVDEVAVAGLLGHGRPHVLGQLVDHLAVGVEHAVHVADVPRAEAAGEHRWVAEEAVAPPEAVVVGDVARALLEVAHQAAPLEDLGEDVRCLLAGQVHAAELGDGVVAVLDEHLLVEVLGALHADGGVDRVVARHVEVADELVEEQPAQALRAAAVAGEQRPLDHLGQVDQGEHGPVEVGEVPAQHVGFGGAVVLRHVQRHERPSYESPRTPIADPAPSPGDEDFHKQNRAELHDFAYLNQR